MRWADGGDGIIHESNLPPPDVTPPDIDEPIARYPEYPGR
jgi:hypothetical protein